jgi:hypothetical protein
MRKTLYAMRKLCLGERERWGDTGSMRHIGGRILKMRTDAARGDGA